MTPSTTPVGLDEEELRKQLRQFREHIEKDHPDPDMRECAWEDDIMSLIRNAINQSRIDELENQLRLEWNGMNQRIIADRIKELSQ